MHNSDTQLKTGGVAELHWEPSFNAGHIGITARDGVVTVSGSVDSWQDRQVAANTVWAAPGTTSVENLITVE